MSNPYLYAGATLMLAGLIDTANRETHVFTRRAADCGVCHDRFRVAMLRWQRTQARIAWLAEISLSYPMER